MTTTNERDEVLVRLRVLEARVAAIRKPPQPESRTDMERELIAARIEALRKNLDVQERRG